jgi:hypothetical protein
MVQIDVPICIGLGSVFAHAARERLATGTREPYLDALSRTLLFHVFFNGWVPIWLLVYHFGFQTSHMWWHADSVAAYPWFIPIFWLLITACTVGGFAAGARLVRAGRADANRALFSSMFVLAFLWIAVQPGRTLRLGTYAQWLAGDTPWMWQDASFIGFVIVITVAWAIGLAVSCRALSGAPSPQS